MALQSLLHDPYISAFLDQIPQNQRIITLKQLIYIGIKIVSSSFHSDPLTANVLSGLENKQNQTINNSKPTKQTKTTAQYANNQSKNDKRFKKSKKSNIYPPSYRADKIQSTLLRQISKIRLQLQSLTNKVYDHYFDENQLGQSQDSMYDDNQKEHDYVQSHGFNYPENIPTFSPPKPQQANTNSIVSNPFLKQKNNFFVTQGNKKPEHQNDRGRSYQAKNPLPDHQNETRNRARSNIMHLDDTQIRQALYRDNQESQTQNIVRNKAKKSHSVIEKNHQQKKKDQQKYFYQLNLDKQNVKQLQKFKEAKPQQLQASYRDFSENVPRTMDPYKKKAKSKIKSLVKRDKQKHRMKQEEQNLKKGLDEYEYSANEVDEDQEEQSNEEDNYQSRNAEEAQGESFSIQKQNLKAQTEKHQRSAQEYSQSPAVENKRQRNISNPNFGFYDSKEQSKEPSRRQNTFNNNQSAPEDNINSNHNQSSFSQFSEFSMSSSSRREVGKISRRRHQ